MKDQKNNNTISKIWKYDWKYLVTFTLDKIMQGFKEECLDSLNELEDTEPILI